MGTASSARQRRREPPPRSAAFLKWKEAATRCGTTAQFRQLTKQLKLVLPFQNLICIWGYHSHHSIRYIFNYGFPDELVRWYLTKGMLWRGPLFREWQRTNRPQVSCSVWKRLAKRIDPQYLEQVKKYKLTGLMAGGVRRRDFWIFIVMNMDSDDACQAFLKQFEAVVPMVGKTLQRACPRPLLTKRENAILEERMSGKIPKEIAAVEAISESTVRQHLQAIKKKLFTNDLVNAVVIAMRSGMLVHGPRRQM